jgi:hypothetical protein
LVVMLARRVQLDERVYTYPHLNYTSIVPFCTRSSYYTQPLAPFV